VKKERGKSLHRWEALECLSGFLFLAIFVPAELLGHNIDHLGKDYFLRGLLVNERNRDAPADHVVGLDGHLALHGVEDFSLNERVVGVQAGHLLADLAHLDDSKARSAILANEVLGNVSWHVLFEHQKVLILLVNSSWVLHEAISQLCATVGTDEVEIKCLSLLVLEVLLEAIRVVLQDAIDRLLTLGAIGGPLSTHQTHQAALCHFNHVVA